MNFDNLVEDVKGQGGIVHADGNIFLTNADKLKSIILKYILADRAASGEAKAWLGRNHATNDESVWLAEDNKFYPFAEPLYTHAQPTPAQIVELRKEKEALRKGFSECFTLWMEEAHPHNHSVSVSQFQDILCNAVLNATDEEIMKDEPL